MPRNLRTLAALAILASVAVAALMAKGTGAMQDDKPTKSTAASEAEDGEKKLAQATFASGCFWCSEAVFQELKGVKTVASGYTGGTLKDPTYEQVCTGTTGHAEAVMVTYDPEVISYEELLEVFWKSHDPTTLNQQGADIGTQYRSAIFYHDEDQKKLAEEYKKKLDESGAARAPIVTEITELGEFYPAEDYHQNYFRDNARKGYCQSVIRPKVEKVRIVFRDKLKNRQERAAEKDTE